MILIHGPISLPAMKACDKYNILLYTYKKYPLILPVFLSKNTQSRITLLEFSDPVSVSSIFYPSPHYFCKGSVSNSPAVVYLRSEQFKVAVVGEFGTYFSKIHHRSDVFEENILIHASQPKLTFLSIFPPGHVSHRLIFMFLCIIRHADSPNC